MQSKNDMQKQAKPRFEASENPHLHQADCERWGDKLWLDSEPLRLSSRRSKSHLHAGEEAISTPTAGAQYTTAQKKHPPLAKPDLFIGAFRLREIYFIYEYFTKSSNQSYRACSGEKHVNKLDVKKYTSLGT